MPPIDDKNATAGTASRFGFGVTFWGLTVAAVAAFLGIIGASAILSRGFHYSEIQLVVYSLERAAGISFLDSVRHWMPDILQHRFIPFYVVHQIAIARFFGERFDLLTQYTVVLGAASLVFLALFARAAGWKPWAGALLALVFAVGPQTEVWWVLDGTEPVALFWMTLGIWLAAESPRKQGAPRFLCDAALLTAIIGMSLCKETFILMTPALLTLRIWMEYRRGDAGSPAVVVQRNSGITAVGIAVALFELGYIATTIGLKGTGYAGVDALRFTGVARAAATIGFKGLGFFLVAVLAVLAAAAAYRWIKERGLKSSDAIRWDGLLALTTAGLFILPAAFVYSKEILDRFIFPGNFGFLLLLFHLFHATDRHLAGFTKKAAAVLFVTLCLLAVSARVGGVRESAVRFIAAGDASAQTLSTAGSFGDRARAVVIVAEPVRHCEISCSFKTYLQKKLNFENVYLYPITKKQYSAFDRDLVRYVIRHFEKKVHTGPELPASVGTVIFLPAAFNVIEKNPPAWFKDGSWKRKDRVGSYAVFTR